jgi:ATP-dependent Clp protease ATP-binding subunit ClpC
VNYEELELSDEDFFASFGRVVTPGERRPALVTASRKTPLEALIESISSPPRRSVLLVGDRGIGKTALVEHALAVAPGQRLAFHATAADLLAGQSFIGMMEGRVQQIAARSRDQAVVWILPNFEETLWAGQHLQSPRGLLDALLPHIEAGAFTVVGEIDTAAFEQLVHRRPKVLELFEIVRIPPMPAEESVEIARAWLRDEAVDAAAGVLEEALPLAEHYLPGLVAPGNLLRLLRATAARGFDGERSMTAETVVAALSEMTGLPLQILDPRTPLSLEDARLFLGRRVLGQHEAVSTLVERIALIKAGLTDPTRPFGVFLFVGPTGTGKTEIAKALAEYLFGSADRLVRLDMSEFQTPESLERLLAEDGTHEAPTSGFIAAIRRQPFSVVLLDEFEKAHENIWDVFLQVFDDGRLTAQSGRTVDLRHTVIVLTSNVGSAIHSGPGVGFVSETSTFSAASVERAVSQTFRPEFLNRLDRVVVFMPLRREVMRSLLEKELADVLRRRGLRGKPWAVEWDESAIDLLIEKGFSAERGARPLKRAVEQYLLAPIAMAIVERQAPAGEQFLLLSAKGSRIRVRFVDPDSDDGARVPPASREHTLRALALEPRGDKAEAEFLTGELARIAALVDHWSGVKDDLLEATHDPAFWETDDRADVLARVEYLDRLAAAFRTAERLAGRLQAGHGRRGKDLVQLLASRLHVLDHACAELAGGEPRDVWLGISPSQTSGESEAAFVFAERLRSMYRAWAEKRGMKLRPLDAMGTAFRVSGLGAHPILERETGLHVLEQPTGNSSYERVKIHVDVTPVSIASVNGAPSNSRAIASVVRRYRFEPSPLVRDHRGWRTGRADRVFDGDFDLFE